MAPGSEVRLGRMEPLGARAAFSLRALFPSHSFPKLSKGPVLTGRLHGHIETGELLMAAPASTQ